MIPKRCVVLACASLSSCALAGGAANNPSLRYTQSYNWTFSTIEDVGNAPVVINNWWLPNAPTEHGSVNHAYRIATTEVTWGQYYEFVQAHARTVPANIREGIVARDTLIPGLGSPFNGPITYLGPGPNGEGRYSFDETYADKPATSTWRLFARMVNWLSNGKPDVDHAVAADFETGVYDVSTFVRISDGQSPPHYTDQDAHTPGAKFWIPSMEELMKAAYYDPNKNGDGQGGWWLYGNSSDDVPIPGDPTQGGQTNAGSELPGGEWPAGQYRPLDVGSYPDELSPWGLLDTVGGGREFTETWQSPVDEYQSSRLTLASRAYDGVVLAELGSEYWYHAASPVSTYLTLRLAAAVPAPGAVPLFALSALVRVRRRPA